MTGFRRMDEPVQSAINGLSRSQTRPAGSSCSHRIVRRDVLVVGLGPFGFESAVLQGEADVGRDRDALRFGKFELFNAKVRMGRSPGCPYTN